MNKLIATAAFVLALVLTGCAHSPVPAPAVQVVYQDRLVEVPKPCPVTAPERPAPLERPLPETPAQLIDVLTAKLAEWSGPGGYGDKASAAIATCTSE